MNRYQYSIDFHEIHLQYRSHIKIPICFTFQLRIRERFFLLFVYSIFRIFLHLTHATFSLEFTSDISKKAYRWRWRQHVLFLKVVAQAYNSVEQSIRCNVLFSFGKVEFAFFSVSSFKRVSSFLCNSSIL